MVVVKGYAMVLDIGGSRCEPSLRMFLSAFPTILWHLYKQSRTFSAVTQSVGRSSWCAVKVFNNKFKKKFWMYNL